MVASISEYPYLFGTLAGLVGVGGLAAFSPGQRGWTLLSGLLATPAALYSLVLIPHYWQPRRVAVLGIGPEDVLFMFGVGALSWLTLARAAPLRIRFDPARLARRLAATYAFTTALAAILSFAGLRTMDAAVAASLVWGSALLATRRGLGRAVARSTAACIALYAAFLLLTVLLWPELPGAWTWSNLWGARFGPVPLEELVWAVAFFPVWGLSVAYMFDAQPLRLSTASPAPRMAERRGPAPGGRRSPARGGGSRCR